METHEIPENGNVPALQLDRQVRLTADWKQLGLKLSEVMAQGFITKLGRDGISAGITALIDAAASIRIETSVGEKVWNVVALALAWALDQLRSSHGVDEQSLRDRMHDLISLAQSRIDAGLEVVPISFLDRPNSLPLYRLLRDELIQQKQIIGLGVNEDDRSLAERLDVAFTRGVYEVLRLRPELYAPIKEAFGSPATAVTTRELNWSAYRRRLVYEFRVRPVFGQELTKISLAQLYVPLRVYWPRMDVQPEERSYSSRHEAYEVGMLEEQIERWLEEAAEGDDIRLVGGGPGSGKSTSLRAIASKVCGGDRWRCLFVPLQHIDLDSDLRDAVNRFFTDRTSGAFTHAPLSRDAVEDGHPLLLLFDGLDELAKPGEAANEIVGLFVSKLTNLISSLHGDGSRQIRVIVSGRMPAFQAARRYISPPPYGCLEVFGLGPLEEPQGRDANPLWILDQRSEWWSQYAGLTGSHPALPAAFSSRALQDLTNEPLLCYLLVLSGFALSNWEQAADNPNRIYRVLVDSIWHRGWGEGSVKRPGPGRSLTKIEFNLLMQTIALAAWQGGDTRVASEQGFLSAVKVAQTEHAWESFKRDSGTDVTNLAMNFYLKASESEQRGFEFTHKSFGDYLAARAILDVAMDLPPLIERKVDHAMTDWLIATGDGAITNEILTFMRNEARLRLVDMEGGATEPKVVELKRSFEKLASTILADGLPSGVGGQVWRVAEKRQAQGETAAWAVINSLSLALSHVDSESRFVKIAWPDSRSSLYTMITRLSGTGVWDNIIAKCLSYVIAPYCEMLCAPLNGADLRGADLSNGTFLACWFIRANLEGANLTKAVLMRSAFDMTNLDNCNLSETNLSDIRMNPSSAKGANLRSALVNGWTLAASNSEFFREHLGILRKAPDFAESDSDSDSEAGAGWRGRGSIVANMLNSIPSDPGP